MAENLPVYFVIGTRAQFIKTAPVMRKMLDQNVPYSLVYTAQHRENIAEILEIYNLPAPDSIMYSANEANTRGAFLRWFLVILFKVLFKVGTYIPKPGIVLVHGDTFTTWLAALMGKRAGCVVGHIESGFRSFNLLKPFPEEISRLITFKFADIFFCADEWAVNNLQRYAGIKINMGANTMLDGVRFALQRPRSMIFNFEKSSYAMVSIHRYENIFTSRLTKTIIPFLQEIANRQNLIFTLHPTTRERLRVLGADEPLESHPNIYLFERFGFVDWIHLCSKAEFVITDGGSNQEELSYLGVPTLLFRSESERREGLGRNVVISRFDKNTITAFLDNLESCRYPPDLSTVQPSEVIVQSLSDFDGHQQQA